MVYGTLFGMALLWVNGWMDGRDEWMTGRAGNGGVRAGVCVWVRDW
jgi:hypothetical protein